MQLRCLNSSPHLFWGGGAPEKGMAIKTLSSAKNNLIKHLNNGNHGVTLQTWIMLQSLNEQSSNLFLHVQINSFSQIFITESIHFSFRKQQKCIHKQHFKCV